MKSVKDFNHGRNICCFTKTIGSSEDNRMGQLKTGGSKNNSERSEEVQARKDKNLKTDFP